MQLFKSYSFERTGCSYILDLSALKKLLVLVAAVHQLILYEATKTSLLTADSDGNS